MVAGLHKCPQVQVEALLAANIQELPTEESLEELELKGLSGSQTSIFSFLHIHFPILFGAIKQTVLYVAPAMYLCVCWGWRGGVIIQSMGMTY